MLNARRAPRACFSCRSQLLALFEHGFTRPTLPIARTKLRDGNGKRTYLTTTNHSNRLITRAFSTTRVELSVDGDNKGSGLREKATSGSENIPEQDLEPSENEEPVEITTFEREILVDMNDEDALDRMDDEQMEKNRDFGQEFAEELVEAERALKTDVTMEMVVRSARERFGRVLPDGVLTMKEYAIYERLYGRPAIEEDIEEELEQNIPSEEIEEGVLKELENMPEADLLDNEASVVYTGEELDAQDGSVSYRLRKSKRKKELERKWQMQVEEEVERALSQNQDASEEDIEENYENEYEEDESVDYEEEDFETGDSIRTHPNTMAGRFGPRPRTIQLPKTTFVKPITEFLGRTHSKHLISASERAFGGPGIPHSASTPMSKHLPAQKHIGLEAGQFRMSEIEADAYLACVFPATYAAVSSALVETRKRLGRSWLQTLLDMPQGPRILDAGAGGAGILAWQEIVKAEWEGLKSDGIVKETDDIPAGRQTVLTGSNNLRHRVSALLENTTFLPRLPDYVHASNPETDIDGGGGSHQLRKKFDVVIAPHTLLPLKDEFKRKNQIQNLWSLVNPDGGVLILIEKGFPLGFEAIAGARSWLLKNRIASPNDSSVENLLQLDGTDQHTEKEKAMIVAPCTNHTKCPMYKIEGFSPGRKDFCHFSQRFIRPAFLQKIVGAKSVNHEDVKFTYLVVQRGVDYRQDQQFQQPNQAQANPLQGEEATKVAFTGYESPWKSTVDIDPKEVNEDVVDAPSEVEIQAEYNATHPNFSTFNLPRLVLPPLKRSQHVTLDLCTPSGTLERWTVPKSFSTQAYRDARKSKWGDLWALGAKVRVGREPRLGRKGMNEKGNGLGKNSRGRQKGGVNKFNIIMGEKGFEGVKEVGGGKVRDGKRTKGGRRDQLPKEIGEDDL